MPRFQIQINGQDVSNASHEQVLEKFRHAMQPFQVEMLARTDALLESDFCFNSRESQLSSDLIQQTKNTFFCDNSTQTDISLYGDADILAVFDSRLNEKEVSVIVGGEHDLQEKEGEDEEADDEAEVPMVLDRKEKRRQLLQREIEEECDEYEYEVGN